MRSLESALGELSDDGSSPPPSAGLADRALKRARGRRRRSQALTSIAAGTAAVLTAAVVTLAVDRDGPASGGSVPAAAASAAADGSLAQPRVDVLLLGVDSGAGRIGTRPDTIILASADTRTGETTLVGLPRALTRVPFRAGTPGARAWPDGFDCGQECLLNAVWAWAEGEGRSHYPDDPRPGLTATTQAVEGITGRRVDETVVMTMRGLSRIVDTIGGVEVTVRSRLPIGGSAADPGATTGWIEPGRRHLNGAQALWYARSRWNSSDADRMARQQCLLGALADQIDTRTLVNTLPEIVDELGGSLSTSLPLDDLTGWFRLLDRMRTAPVHRVAVTAGNAAAPDYGAIRRQVATAIDDGGDGGRPGGEPGC